jgi:hypothetical protein
MKALIALAFILASLTLAAALSACSDDVGSEYYDNDLHHGYPGPATTSPQDSQ